MMSKPALLSRPSSAVPLCHSTLPGPTSQPSILARASLILLVATAAACASDSGGTEGTGGSGSGGRGGSGGSAGSGGTTVGSGGVGSGGTATGGTSAKGGSSGSGGVASGGTTGQGGAATGGRTGRNGGATGFGGRTTGQGGDGSGGATGQGGVALDGGAGRDAADARGTGGQVTGTGGARVDGGLGGVTGTGGGTGTTFNPCPTTAGTACKVMPLGDSITEGFGSSGQDGGGPANQGGYRIELFRQSVKQTKNLTFVGNQSNGPSTIESKSFPKKHEGHGGWTISQIAGIADSTISSNTPNIIILKIGTNDVNGTGASGAPTGLKNLIDQIAKDAPNALLVVSSIIPIKDDNQNQKVKTYNATIPTTVDAAAAAGKHVIFVDSYAAFVADSSFKTKYMSDNLHPNDAGYQLLGQTFFKAISAVLPSGP